MVFMLGVTSWAFAQEQSAASDGEVTATEQEIAALIEQLISPNPAPTKLGTPILKLPDGYDKEKQRTVSHARLRLKELGPRAFPQLSDHFADRQYSMTVRAPLSDAIQNLTVGNVCWNIVADQVQPYSIWPESDEDPRQVPRRPSYPAFIFKDSKSTREWCRQHREKSLFQIQMMALEWVIAEEAKRPKDYSEAEKEKLASLRVDLLKSGKPIQRGSYTGYDTP